MGNYDIPAMINKVLQVTGQEQLYYVGESSIYIRGSYNCYTCYWIVTDFKPFVNWLLPRKSVNVKLSYQTALLWAIEIM